MSKLGLLLEAAAKKKPAAKKSTGTTVTVKVGSGGGAVKADPKAQKKSGGSKTKSPEAQRSKTMGELLKHADESMIYARQKSFEHGQWENYHNKSRVDRHLANFHRMAREHYEGLRRVYHKLGNEAYRISKPKLNEKDNEKKKSK